MAKLRIECDFCGRSFTVPPSMTGEKVACECGSFIQVPEQSAEEMGEKTTEKGASELPEEGWFIHQGGQSVGPKSLEDLRDMARRGELEPKQNVYNPQEGNWRAASSVGALSSEFPPPAVEGGAGGEEDRRWYVRAGQEKYGPYTADRVREMVEKNQLRARSLIWHAELDDWVELHSIEPFSAIWAGEETEDTPEEEEQEAGPPPAPEAEPIPEEEKTRAEEEAKPAQEEAKPARRGITQNIKGLFSSGKNKRSKGNAESTEAQIPSTVLTVEYVDDGEGMEAALGEIAQTLEALQKTTKQVQEFTSRLARAVDQQNRRTNEAIESLRRRMDKLYRHVERIGMETQASAHPVPPMPEEEPVETANPFGVPADYADDEAHQRAWQVARVMVGDLEAYHPEDVREGITYGNLREVLGEEIEEAWQTYRERIPQRVRQEVDYLDMALQELVARKTEEMEEEGS